MTHPRTGGGMTRDDILRMAREAGVRVARMLAAVDNNEAALTETEARDIAAIERFAALVCEHTWKEAGIAATRTVLDAAVLEEREACAKVAERMLRFYTQAVTGVPEAIRARSNT